MSVFLESQAGDEIICIMGFHAAPEGVTPSRETAREFRVGERVRYAGFRHEHRELDHPSDWMVLFDARDGKRYAATQVLFVTEECWQGLKHYFAKRLLKEPTRGRLPRPANPGP